MLLYISVCTSYMNSEVKQKHYLLNINTQRNLLEFVFEHRNDIFVERILIKHHKGNIVILKLLHIISVCSANIPLNELRKCLVRICYILCIRK